MMLKKISIPIFSFDTETGEIVGEPEFIRVWAWVDGPFAIHRWRGERFGYEVGNWTITHIPSGCRMNGHPLRRGYVGKLLAWAKNFEWHGRRILEDAPVCELFQYAPMVYADLGREEEGRLWAKRYRPQLEAIHHCPDIVHRLEAAYV